MSKPTYYIEGAEVQESIALYAIKSHVIDYGAADVDDAYAILIDELRTEGYIDLDGIAVEVVA